MGMTGTLSVTCINELQVKTKPCTFTHLLSKIPVTAVRLLTASQKCSLSSYNGDTVPFYILFNSSSQREGTYAIPKTHSVKQHLQG